MICLSFLATAGVLTPLHGCRYMIWSLSAVVKIALRITMQYSITAGLFLIVARWPLRRGASSWVPCWNFTTHSRTSEGRISTIFMGPKEGRMTLSRYRT